MGWEIGFDTNWKRDIGYGVPAICDHPECATRITRGLPFVCGGEPYGGDDGCGLYFCEEHLTFAGHDSRSTHVCGRCAAAQDQFEPKPDALVWIEHKLTDASWAQWRLENPGEVAAMRVRLALAAPGADL